MCILTVDVTGSRFFRIKDSRINICVCIYIHKKLIYYDLYPTPHYNLIHILLLESSYTSPRYHDNETITAHKEYAIHGALMECIVTKPVYSFIGKLVVFRGSACYCGCKDQKNMIVPTVLCSTFVTAYKILLFFNWVAKKIVSR